jgi:hypothetical protein
VINRLFISSPPKKDICSPAFRDRNLSDIDNIFVENGHPLGLSKKSFLTSESTKKAQSETLKATGVVKPLR